MNRHSQWQNMCIAVFLTFAFAQSAFAQEPVVSFFHVTAINPTSTQYPSGRGTNELVVYSPAWRSERTGTNPYGAEAEVRAGIVTGNGGNDRPIPKDGYILSGHGVAAHWIQSINVGDSIVLRGDSCIVLATSRSIRVKAASILVQLASKHVQPSLTKEIESLRDLRDVSGDLQAWRRKHRELDSLYAMAIASAMPSVKDEWRGVWHRPREWDAEGVDAVVGRVANAHLNAIFLETFWNGQTIYPSEFAERHTEFGSFDVLQAYVNAGRKYGVQIHAWVHTFFLGYRDTVEKKYEMSRALMDHPEWKLVHKNGSTYSGLEPGYVWACPANPEVQDYVTKIYREILTKYAVAGIQHDYIRFPSSGTIDERSCFCAYCRAHVKAELGFDLNELQETDSVRMGSWNTWKEERITRFVRSIRGKFPDRRISAAVFPDIKTTRKDKMQNWTEWTRTGTIDLLSPMCYTSSKEEVASGLREMHRLAPGTIIAAGIAPFLGLRTDQLLEQIEIARQTGSTGVIFFELTTISDLSLAAFASGPFRERTSPPIFKQN